LQLKGNNASCVFVELPVTVNSIETLTSGPTVLLWRIYVSTEDMNVLMSSRKVPDISIFSKPNLAFRNKLPLKSAVPNFHVYSYSGSRADTCG
jgi:hypothetical protein